jgi:hypothetical protein
MGEREADTKEGKMFIQAALYVHISRLNDTQEGIEIFCVE